MLPIYSSFYKKDEFRWKFSREAEYITVGKGCSKKRMPCVNSEDRVDNDLIRKNADLEQALKKFIHIFKGNSVYLQSYVLFFHTFLSLTC